MAREYAPAEVFSNKTNEQIFAPLPSMQSERTGGILYVVLFQYTDKRLGGNVSKLLKWLSMNCGIKSVQRKMLNYFCDVFLICNLNVLGTFCIHSFVSIFILLYSPDIIFPIIVSKAAEEDRPDPPSTSLVI